MIFYMYISSITLLYDKIKISLILSGLLQVNRRGKEGSKEVQRGVLLSSEEFAMSDRAKVNESRTHWWHL